MSDEQELPILCLDITQNMTTRRYDNADLKGLTKQKLIDIIELQPQYIPKRFNRSKMRKADLERLILSPTSRFTTSKLRSEGDPESTAQEEEEAHSSRSASVPFHAGHQPPQPLTSTSSRMQPEEPDGNVSDQSRTTENKNVEPTVGDHGNMEIRLYIEDGRCTGTLREKTSKTINIEAVLTSPNTVQISMHDVLRELQAGYGAITGTDSVRVGVQDLASPDYTDFFVESVPSDLHMATTDPTTHIVRVDSGILPSLRLRVDHAYPDPKINATNLDMQSSSAPPRDETQIIEWLRSKAADSDDYQHFSTSKHRRLRQNSDIWRSWKFAAEFSARYYKQMHPFSMNNGKIKKSDIYTALDVRDTWLSQAEEAHRIIKIFGDGGSHPSPDVISKLSQIDELPQGSGLLLQFLRDWNRNHAPSV